MTTTTPTDADRTGPDASPETVAARVAMLRAYLDRGDLDATDRGARDLLDYLERGDPGRTADAATLAERRTRHPHEFAVRDAVRGARAVLHFTLGDEHGGGFESVAWLHRDVLEGVAELLRSADAALECVTALASPSRVPDAPERIVGEPLAERIEGMPADLADAALTRSLAVVRLLGAAGDVSAAERRALLSTAHGLLDVLADALERMALFAPDAPAPAAA